MKRGLSIFGVLAVLLAMFLAGCAGQTGNVQTDPVKAAFAAADRTIIGADSLYKSQYDLTAWQLVQPNLTAEQKDILRQKRDLLARLDSAIARFAAAAALARSNGDPTKLSDVELYQAMADLQALASKF